MSTLSLVLLIVLILLLVGAFPAMPWAAGLGYGPSGVISVLLVVVLIVAILRIV